MLPLDHPEPSRIVVALTGLTHLGSAQSRDAMHAKLQATDLTDSMKMFKLGIEGGKPAAGEIGVQPEWAYKGDGSWLVAPEQPIELPGYAEDGGEEGEVAGLYVIGDDGEVLRVGFALGNEYSDHVMERRNYLYLAHSKLRQSSFGPEVLIGALPEEVKGKVRILRGGKEAWSGELLSGESEHVPLDRQSRAASFQVCRLPPAGRRAHLLLRRERAEHARRALRPQPGDVFEVEAAPFGRPLRNPLVARPSGSRRYPSRPSDRIARTRLEMTEELHHNLIAGEWVEGEGETDNINPSNTDEVVGRYARASKADTERAIAAAKAAAAGLGALQHPCALRDPEEGRRTRFWRARKSSAGCSRARKERRSPKARWKRRAPGRFLRSSPARRCASPASS